jgi:hypothetical protein
MFAMTQKGTKLLSEIATLEKKFGGGKLPLPFIF